MAPVLYRAAVALRDAGYLRASPTGVVVGLVALEDASDFAEHRSAPVGRDSFVAPTEAIGVVAIFGSLVSIVAKSAFSAYVWPGHPVVVLAALVGRFAELNQVKQGTLPRAGPEITRVC